jgi:hypothetical protein
LLLPSFALGFPANCIGNWALRPVLIKQS